RDRHTVHHAYRFRLAGVRQAVGSNQLTGVCQVVVQLVHELHHVPDPFGSSFLHHASLIAEHHDHVLHLGFSWTVHPLPSGSLKKMNEFHGPPGPSTHSPLSTCRTGVTSTSRSASWARAASTSSTQSWSPFKVPGDISP